MSSQELSSTGSALYARTVEAVLRSRSFDVLGDARSADHHMGRADAFAECLSVLEGQTRGHWLSMAATAP